MNGPRMWNIRKALLGSFMVIAFHMTNNEDTNGHWLYMPQRERVGAFNGLLIHAVKSIRVRIPGGALYNNG
jgi:hypothetical protein